MALPTFYDYKGYRIVVQSARLRRDGTLAASVTVATPDLTIVHRAPSLVTAMRWVDALIEQAEAAISIHTLDAADRELLDRYCEIDEAIGEAFADADCSRLVPNWIEIAERRIAQKEG